MADIRRALDLWIEITGVDPEAKSLRIGNYEIYKINQELKESLEFDPSTILTMLLLDYYTEEYLNNRNFSVNEILKDFDALMNYLASSKELYAVLRSEDIRTIRSDFEDHMLISIKQYGEVSENVIKTIKSPHDLAFLRRDALKSFETLGVFQFYQGKPDGRPPKFLEYVYEFWNINSLLRMIASTKESFISLNLIRDPEYHGSYFVFAMKNGETLSVICDKPNWAHPLQKNMIRRPDRDFANRIAKNHFPYSLMELEYDEDQRGVFLKQKSESTDVVLFQEEIHKLKMIKDLNPNEIIWITMMFQLIKEKFWDKDFKTNEIAYTGAMVTINHDREKELIIPNQLVVPAFTASKINPETTKDQWGRTPTGQHDWMEKRYEKDIPDSVLTLTGVGDGKIKFLTAGDVETITTANEIDIKGEPSYISDRKPLKHMLAGISPTEFGTEESILRDMQWNARYNQAKATQLLANQEFEKRKEEVADWYERRVKKNIHSLLKAVAEGKLEAFSESDALGFRVNPDELKNILTFADREFPSHGKGVRFSRGFDKAYFCYLNGCQASIAAYFNPTTAHGIATICGCTVSQLPDVIQNWRRDELYGGNHILDRLDPMEWVVKDPWKKMSFEVTIYLSLSGYNMLCKQYGTKPNAKSYRKGRAI